MTLKEMQTTVDAWITQYGVRYFNELTNLALLMEEVGEFSRITARMYGEQSFKDSEDAESATQKLEDEFADILFVMTCLANQMNIDMEQAVLRNLEKKTHRDKERHTRNPKLK
jgi:NTP pyrophosphatase (non-canonical NTP hydrolase)